MAASTVALFDSRAEDLSRNVVVVVFVSKHLFSQCADIPEGIYSSFPVVCNDNDYQIVDGVKVDKFFEEKIEVSVKELLSERDAVAELI